MQVEGAAARLLGVEVDLPGLAQRVGLDEVPLVVHVEPVIDGVVLEVGDEAGHIDDSHGLPSLPWRNPDAATVAPTVTPSELLPVLNRAADAVVDALEDWSEWGPSGQQGGAVQQRPGRRRRRGQGARGRRAGGAQRGVGPAPRRPRGGGGPRPARRVDQRLPGDLVVGDEPVRRRRRGPGGGRGRRPGARHAVRGVPRSARGRDGHTLVAVGTVAAQRGLRRAVGPAAAPPRVEAVPCARRLGPRPVRRRRRPARRLRRLQPRRPRAVGLHGRACSSASRPARAWSTPAAATWSRSSTTPAAPPWPPPTGCCSSSSSTPAPLPSPPTDPGPTASFSGRHGWMCSWRAYPSPEAEGRRAARRQSPAGPATISPTLGG